MICISMFWMNLFSCAAHPHPCSRPRFIAHKLTDSCCGCGRRFFNRENALSKFLARGAYAAYVLHPCLIVPVSWTIWLACNLPGIPNPSAPNDGWEPQYQAGCRDGGNDCCANEAATPPEAAACAPGYAPSAHPQTYDDCPNYECVPDGSPIEGQPRCGDKTQGWNLLLLFIYLWGLGSALTWLVAGRLTKTDLLKNII